MSEKELFIIGAFGLAAFLIYEMKNNNSGEKINDPTSAPTNIPTGTNNLTSTPTVMSNFTQLSKVGGNPKTEEQPIVSTNNAQQPPTVIETMSK